MTRILVKHVLPLQTVAELGVVIFTALDFGLKEDEERQLSSALENVIDLMTSAGEEQRGSKDQIKHDTALTFTLNEFPVLCAEEGIATFLGRTVQRSCEHFLNISI